MMSAPTDDQKTPSEILPDNDAATPLSSFLNYTPLTANMFGGFADGLVTDEESGGPGLGADMAAIRARVLGRRADVFASNACAGPGSGLTPDEHREVYDELLLHNQVDLNLEANAANLEDPTLIVHMEKARTRLAEQEKALLRLPQREDLRTTYINSVGELSTLIRALDIEHQANRENVETGHLLARDLHTLAAGQKPHGFSAAFGAVSLADPDTKEAMCIAENKAITIAASYEKLHSFVGSVARTLFLLRRDIETFGDGLFDLIEASEEDRRRLREVLQIVPDLLKGGARTIADPTHA